MAGIDRDYWLDFAKDGVSKSIESREKAADKLDTFLGWTWLVYTSIFALGTLLNFVSSNIWQLFWLAQPILIIMLARYFCTLVSMPSTNNDDSTRADPNDVASIIDSFILIVDDKRKKLRIAKIFTFISIFSITAALIGYNYCDPDKTLKQEIHTAKLKKELNDQEFTKQKMQQSINDSIKLVNDFYDNQIQNTIKKRKLDCVAKEDVKCQDSLKHTDK
jgi:hypothetical protein